MQTLGISNSNPASESRLKSLFWPSIQSGSDVDYLGAQGYWMCALVAVFCAVILVIAGQPVLAAVAFLFYYLGGVGVREHSDYAAAVVLAMFVLDILASGPSVLRVIVAALLLSNLRATWIASKWKPDSPEAALPPRFSETWGDKFADVFPKFLWPKVRILYYIFSAGFLALVIFGLTMLRFHRRG